MEIITLFVALSISGVAAYYSIIGLGKIFAGAFLPIVIMGGVLEVGKIVTALWLHRHWERVPRLLRFYLVGAVIVLMLLTSMGIFGFLSSAHIEQTANARQSIAQIEQLDTNIRRQEAIISTSFAEIEKIETASENQNDQINVQIEKELARIETVRASYNDLVNEQRDIIEDASSTLDLLEKYIADQNIEALQTLVGAKVDGNYGRNTAKKVETFRESEKKIADSVVATSRERINSLRDAEREELKQSNELLDRLRERLGVQELSTVQRERIDRLKNNIETAENTIDNLREEKYTLETDYRKLEAEVGPVKYIAEMIYGDADAALLENAVRWVIVAIVFVFDPLAILLLIAAQIGLTYRKETAPEAEEEKALKDADELLIKTNTGWQRLSKSKKKRQETLDKPFKE